MSHLKEAFESLEGKADVVLGPSDDGGYNLVGMREPHPEIFPRITWSTHKVLAETLERADESGLSVCQLEPWYDVDTVPELDRHAAELFADPNHPAHHTREQLDEWKHAGILARIV